MNLGHKSVQNIGFIGGHQGIFFEKMLQKYNVTTNYIYTNNEIRNNVQISGSNPPTYTYYNAYTYDVEKKDVDELIKRFNRSISDSDFVLISGSIPGGVDVDIYQKLIDICNSQKKDVFLQASGDELTLALKAKPKVVAPYFKHVDKILDEKVSTYDDFIKVGHKLLQYGAQNVILPFDCKHILFTKNKSLTYP